MRRFRIPNAMHAVVMPHDKQIVTRVPAKLVDALADRAHALGQPLAAVTRRALAREAARPIDASDRTVVEAWLAGADLEGAATEAQE